MATPNDSVFSNYADIYDEDGYPVGMCWYPNENANTVLTDKLAAVRQEIGQPQDVVDEGIRVTHTICIDVYDSGETIVADEFGAYDTMSRELLDYRKIELSQSDAVSDLAKSAREEINRLEIEVSREKVATQEVEDGVMDIYDEYVPF